MQVSLDWLNDFVDLSGISPEEIAHKLTMSGLEVEEVEYRKIAFENIKTVQIIKIDNHPNADKLHLVTVTNGVEEKVVVKKETAPAKKEEVVKEKKTAPAKKDKAQSSNDAFASLNISAKILVIDLGIPKGSSIARNAKSPCATIPNAT